MENHPEHLDEPEPRSRRGPLLIGLAVLAVLAVLVVVIALHLTGVVGPGRG